MVFDTTASNTGIRNGCAVLIECELKHSLLWLACRHHIYETHIKNIWKAITGATSGPDDLLFKGFKSQWGNLDHDNLDFKIFEWPSDEKSNIHIEATEVLKWAKECLAKDSFPRADYRELLELTVIFLGGYLPASRKFRIRKPGAVPHARFMSKNIYILKMYLLSDHIELDDKDYSTI